MKSKPVQFKIVTLLSILSFVGAAHLFASDVEKEKMKVEKELENVISNEIRKYYSDLKFLIAADATLSEIAGAETPDERDIMLPGVKGFQADRKENAAKPQYAVDGISIKILVDKNGTHEDKELLRLIENIAFYVGKLNRERGDKVELQEFAFPQTAAMQQTQAAQFADSAFHPASVEKQNSAFTPLTIGSLAFVFVLLVLVYLLVRKNKIDQMKAQQALYEADKKFHEQQEIQELQDETKALPMVAESMQRATDAAELQKLKSNIIATSVGNTAFTATVVREIIADPASKVKLQSVISYIGINIVGLMKEHFSDEENVVLH